MKTLFFGALAMFCATVASEEHCKFAIPITESSLKCEDQVYHRSKEDIAAVNHCAEGKDGKEITITDTACIFEKLGFTKNGQPNPVALSMANIRNFPKHHQALTNGTLACARVHTKESDLKDPHAHVACRLKVFEDVCKHKTCDWMNTLD